MKRLVGPPRYTEEGRYAYHFCCTKILPSRIALHKGQTHGCWCSAWKQQDDGTFLQWRDGAWRNPKRGDIKSKPNNMLSAYGERQESNEQH